MQDILKNLANIELLNFCKTNGIDPSGTRCEKYKRGANYALYVIETGEPLVTVDFSKNNVPQFGMSEEASSQRLKKINRLRTNAPGYILGELTPYASDSDVLDVCEMSDRKATIHNRALSQAGKA